MGRPIVHGGWKTPEYEAWTSMKKRCYKPYHASFYNYGARGITVCERWMNDFPAFLSDVGPRPSPEHSLERKDNALGYFPDNCKWATSQEQALNRRDNRLLTLNGETRPMIVWAEEVGLPYETIQSRLRRGWTVERSLTAPVDHVLYPVKRHKRS